MKTKALPVSSRRQASAALAPMPRPTPSPAAAGFRPAGAALAIATAFMAVSNPSLAQPAGAQVIHGQASLVQRGSSLVVTTQNGPGTAHSAINWQSFSVPVGSTTQFVQPGASSTSINRVLGSNPSAIYGTLSSNGRLVLVNPSGIAVGAGAVVDTAGFTASALRMSDADALAGRLVFGDGLPGGALRVDGQVLARSGDVVLIARDVHVGTDAIVQSPSGATLLAAGQKVELTGRGLEGIRLELQAPGDQALNLGTLQGDAVGIFAGQLKHSGLIQASAATIDGGKVVLKAQESADIAGLISAKRGDVGGQVHATAGKVMLRSGAVIDVSGEQGGGEALIGGGWQGKDSRIANATDTTIEAGATIKADAIDKGNGGTVVAWSDESTRVYGNVSSRGGAEAGDGGQIETSGKRFLDFAGVADMRAPKGEAGTLLLDPSDITIQAAGTDTLTLSEAYIYGSGSGSSILTTTTLNNQLNNYGNVRVTTTTGTGAVEGGHITVADPILWTNGNTLGLEANNGVEVNASITGGVGSVLALRGDSGSVTQGASGAISVSKLWAHTLGGAITLTNSANAVSTFAAYSNSGDITFVNIGDLTIGSVDAGLVAMGSMAGVTNNSNQAVSLTVNDGNLVISDTSNGLKAGLGNVTLSVPDGSISQTANSPITAGSLVATAGSDIVVNGSMTAGSLSLTSTGGSILQGTSGLLKSNTISLKTGSGMSIGSVGSSLMTTPNSGSTSFSIGDSTFGPGQVNIGHTGNASIDWVKLNPTGTFAFSASGNVTVTSSIDAGTQDLKLGAGNLLTVDAPVDLQAGRVFLSANDMDLPGSAIGSDTGGDIWVQTTTPGRTIELGSTLNGTALKLDTNELAAFSTDGTLRIGSTTLGFESGDIFIGAAIAPTGAGVLSLRSGGNITQSEAGTISAAKLAVNALGNVSLDTAPNMVGSLAGGSGDSNSKDFRFRNGSTDLQIGLLIDGMSGITVSLDGGNYVYTGGGADGAIALTSAGELTQEAGATLKGKAVYAQGSKVLLDQANEPGVIAGKATGSATGDIFKYASSGADINVNTVNAFSGIQHANPLESIAIFLSGTSVNQDSTAPITSGGGLHATATSGSVALTATGNEVSSFGATATGGSVAFTNATGLTVSQAITAGTGITLSAQGTDGQDFTVNASLSAGSGGVSLESNTGDIVLNGGGISGAGAASLTAGGVVKVAGTVSLASSVGSAQFVNVEGGTLNLAGNVVVPNLYLGSGGTITGSGNLTVGSQLDWGGGSMAGLGQTIIDTSASMNVSGAVALSRPIVNNGTITLYSAGDITLDYGASLANAGTFDILNDGGLAMPVASPVPVSNTGLFKKTGGTGVSLLDGISFMNPGTLLVSSGTLKFGAANFSSNAGVISLVTAADAAAPSTLDNSNTTLANTFAGVVAGTGVLKLGTGTFNNEGFLKPGGYGQIGTLTIDAATVNLLSGTSLYVDISNSLDGGVTYDDLRLTGATNVSSTSVVVTPNFLAGASVATGDEFDFVKSLGTLALVDGTTPPAVSGFTLSIVEGVPNAIRAVATAPYPTLAPTGGTGTSPPPEPTPEPTPAPTPEPTPAPTPEPTPAPTPEPTPAPTPEPTPAPTPEPTPAPTLEPTPVPTAPPVTTTTVEKIVEILRQDAPPEEVQQAIAKVQRAVAELDSGTLQMFVTLLVKEGEAQAVQKEEEKKAAEEKKKSGAAAGDEQCKR